ncbi:hypothetical protein [Mycolicibacter engbaekii]|uniref:hypothetical protein n=1 Tax=Mycolicibacter engbaekii TaxID=188915 RepID=UPI0010547F4D|nr:hypothetical protein [Mycolicibacter engbaekii]
MGTPLNVTTTAPQVKPSDRRRFDREPEHPSNGVDAFQPETRAQLDCSAPPKEGIGSIRSKPSCFRSTSHRAQ